MIDKNFARFGARKMRALWSLITETARDIDYASRLLHRIQYDRPWDRPAGCDAVEGRNC
jgi:hypothetical protein